MRNSTQRILSSALLTAGALVTGCRGYTGAILATHGADGTASAGAAGVMATRTVSWALDRIDQRGFPLDSTFRRRGTGRGVTVYVFDGGISATHPELIGRVRTGYTAYPEDPPICNGHGTGVAGAIAGKTLGVAPDAEIVDVKIIDCDALRCAPEALADASDWVIEDHAARGGPAIVNWSFLADTTRHVPVLDSAVTRLLAAGIPVIVSAGNVDADACRMSPANAAGTLVVGAVGTNARGTRLTDPSHDWRAPESGWGPCVDLYAPGVYVELPGWDDHAVPMTEIWSGTSFAAGYVSGAAALYLERNREATPGQVIAALKADATPGAVVDVRCPGALLLYVGTGPPSRTVQAGSGSPRVAARRR